MLNRKTKLKSLQLFIAMVLLLGLSQPGSVFASEETNNESEFVISEAYLTGNVIGHDPSETDLVLNVSHESRLSHVNIYDMDNDLSGYFRGDNINNETLEPGENQLTFDANYCPSFATPTDCVYHNFDLPTGVYNLEVRVTHEGSFVEDTILSPFFVKTTAPEITFDSNESPVENETISGKISDEFIDWGEELEFDVSDFLEASFRVLNEDGNTVKSGGLTVNQDGTFTISLARLPAGNYSAEVTVNDAGGNTAIANTELFTHLERINGSSRYNTAIEVSQRGWNSADTVVLARGDDFADALAGVPLAHMLDAPILMSVPDRLLDNTLTEMKRLGTKNVVILGGEVAINKSVADDLKNAGFNVRRIDGDSRFETAALIASEMTPNGTDKVVVANGMDFPDALSAASSAAKEELPILLTLDDRIPVATDAKLKELGVNETIVVGGNKVISDEVEGLLPTPIRLEGADRYGTNIAIAEYFGVENKDLYIATGQNYADALTGAVLAAKENSAILLVHHRVPSSVTTYLNKHQANSLSIFGGEEAVSIDVENGLRELLQ